MEKRSGRRVRDLVTQMAFQGLSENEIGRARISMMARSNLLQKGPDTDEQDHSLYSTHSACNARPVHTVGSNHAGFACGREPVGEPAEQSVSDRGFRLLSGGGFNWSAQHLLILLDKEVSHGDVTDLVHGETEV